MLWRMKLFSPSRTVSFADMKYPYWRTTQNMNSKNKLLILKLLCSPLQLQKASPMELVTFFQKHLLGISYTCSFPGHNEHGISKHCTVSIIQLKSLPAVEKEVTINQARGGIFSPCLRIYCYNNGSLQVVWVLQVTETTTEATQKLTE